MTANQLTAIDIASKVLRGELVDADLDDEQWALVSLASSLGHSRCGSRMVFSKVIADFRAASGFFADLSENDIAKWDSSLPATEPMTTPHHHPLAPLFHAAR